MRYRLTAVVPLGALLASATAYSDVDPDCRAKPSNLCASARLGDAQAADDLLAPTIAAAGWSRPCFTLMYISGDAGEADAISITLHGPKGADAATCSTTAARVTKSLLRQIASRVKNALHGHKGLTRHVDTLQLTDGVDTEVRVQLP